MKHILVTGANGFVGRHLMRELTANGYRVTGVGGPLQPGQSSTDLAGDYKVLDLSDAAQCAQLDFSDVDGVIHLAGLAAVGPSFDEPFKYLQINGGIQINLFETALKQQRTPRFLIISSGSLYDPKAPLPLTEQSPVLPSSPYAVSKLTQEFLGKHYGGRGFEVITARPFNHIGPGQGEGFIVPDLAKQVVSVEKGSATEIKVGNLEAERDYTDVRDIVRAYRLMIEQGVAGRTYNVCSGTAHSGQEILDGLLALSSAKPSIVADASKMRPTDNPVIRGSHDLLTRDTEWAAEIGLEVTLVDALEDWRSK